MDITFVYSPEYDIRFFGLEKLHPFDSGKYGRAWQLLEERFGEALTPLRIEPAGEISGADLLLVHSQRYLDSLNDAVVLATALELPFLAQIPAPLIHGHILRPMRLATEGTSLAVQRALQTGGVAVNLSGGYHHASGERGEGFCLYADVAIAVARARRGGQLTPGKDRILYIDLDAHQGNGVERAFLNDPALSIVDAYNAAIYPQDRVAEQRIDRAIPLPPGTGNAVYLARVHETMTEALRNQGPFPLAIYNAGTDVHADDQLGGLALTDAGVLQRDTLVLDALIAAQIPTVVLPSGGYSTRSYHLIYETLRWLLETHRA